jgi:hypothetical protein
VRPKIARKESTVLASEVLDLRHLTRSQDSGTHPQPPVARLTEKSFSRNKLDPTGFDPEAKP